MIVLGKPVADDDPDQAFVDATVALIEQQGLDRAVVEKTLTHARERLEKKRQDTEALDAHFADYALKHPEYDVKVALGLTADTTPTPSGNSATSHSLARAEHDGNKPEGLDESQRSVNVNKITASGSEPSAKPNSRSTTTSAQASSAAFPPGPTVLNTATQAPQQSAATKIPSTDIEKFVRTLHSISPPGLARPLPFTASLYFNTEVTARDRAAVVIGKDGYAHNWPLLLKDRGSELARLVRDFDNWHLQTAKEILTLNQLQLTSTGVDGFLRRTMAMVGCEPGELTMTEGELNLLRDIFYLRTAITEWYGNLQVPAQSLCARNTRKHKHFNKIVGIVLALFERYVDIGCAH